MPQLTIIVPVYNEEKTLSLVIDRLIELPIDKEIIIVDDGSTDGSTQLLKSINKPNIIKVSHESNLGKGSAVRTGIAAASGDIIAIQDADLEYSPDELIRLVKFISSGEYEIVFGSRFKKENPVIYFHFFLGNKLMSFIISLIAFRNMSDTYTCYKIFRKNIIANFNLVSRGFELEAELSVNSALSGARFIEVPISYNPRKVSEGKKIRWTDMLKGIAMAVRTRFCVTRRAQSHKKNC